MAEINATQSVPGTVVASGSLVTPGGEQGTAGAKWWNGSGAPTPPPSGSNPGDYYLDITTGDVYLL